MNESNLSEKQRSHLRMYLYNLRKRLGLSIYQVTNKLILSNAYYYQIEQGTRGHKMDVVMLNDLATLFEVSLESLCREEFLYQLERRSKGLRCDRRWILTE